VAGPRYRKQSEVAAAPKSPIQFLKSITIRRATNRTAYMSRLALYRTLPQAICVVLICALACSFILTAQAGIRAPGKYCGVIVFDRWDTCLLLSGHFITYISDGVKNELRPYVGKAMQLDALEVSQPRNPGDASVRRYQIIGPAPNNHYWVTLDRLELAARSDFGPQGTATFLIELHNTGSQAVTVNRSEFGPTLLGSNPKAPFWPSDSRTGAWITRVGLLQSSSSEIWSSTPRESWSGTTKYSASFTIDPKSLPPERCQLAPGQSLKVRVTFKASSGQYQFIVGYGGGVHEGKSLASNAISFDLNDAGIATLAKPELSSAR
jgi:hypothetical protein